MIGQLDQRVTFQVATDTPDGAGGITKIWANIAPNPTVWAKVIYRSGKEQTVGDRTVAQAGVMFTIRNRRDLTEEMRILWNDRAHVIRAVRDFGPREMYLKIECETGVPT